MGEKGSAPAERCDDSDLDYSPPRPGRGLPVRAQAALNPLPKGGRKQCATFAVILLISRVEDDGFKTQVPSKEIHAAGYCFWPSGVSAVLLFHPQGRTRPDPGRD